MNEFEQDVQSKRNDFIDSAVGFIASFGFFATIFILAGVIKAIGS
ncbi:YqzM family protein [Caldifermentibacillus hisashii]